MRSKRSHEGVILIDNRHAPDFPIEEFRRNGFKGHIAGADAKLFESATVTCAHCGTVVILNPDRTRARGYCRKCDHYVCDKLLCNSECKPFKAHIDELEKKAHLDLGRGLSPLFGLRRGTDDGEA